MVLIDKLNNYTISLNGCWEWNGCLSKDGYGRYDSNNTAHRESFLFFNGEIPKHKEIDHLCRNRKCMNPKHLRLVTHKQNMETAVCFNTRKTQCIRGHEFNEENTITYTYLGYKKRQCRICHNKRRTKGGLI